MDIWQKCRERISLLPLQNELIRVVESQEQIATNQLVDNFAEQALLEQMLEMIKPTLPGAVSSLHYLLQTPFRYPPLKYGSRFGNRFEPGLFYGSLRLSTAFAETAYYRFVFWRGMAQPPSSGKFTTQHTVFTATYATRHGLKLQEAPFNEFETELINPRSYVVTQKLGRAMRESGIEAFEFKSARDREQGLNIALFTAAALSTRQPLYQQAWICDTSKDMVSFYSSIDGHVYQYPLENFLVEKQFPIPGITG